MRTSSAILISNTDEKKILEVKVCEKCACAWQDVNELEEVI